jgi:hypothetical protein
MIVSRQQVWVREQRQLGKPRSVQVRPCEFPVHLQGEQRFARTADLREHEQPDHGQRALDLD